jgi:hypothetical protein
MTPTEFAEKCKGVPTCDFAFEKGAEKIGGGSGWAESVAEQRSLGPAKS